MLMTNHGPINEGPLKTSQEGQTLKSCFRGREKSKELKNGPNKGFSREGA